MAPSPLSAALALVVVAAAAAAQAPPARPDPLDPQAAVPALRHASAFRHYLGAGDDTRIDWKQANETVARIGGWRAYARAAAAPASAASAAAPR